MEFAFLARLVDTVYGTILGLVVGFCAGIVFAILSQLGKLTPQWPLQLLSQHRFTGFGLGIIGAFLYHSLAEGVGGVTIGKLICGLRVVQMDGTPATMKGSLIRDLGYHIDALFFGLIAYHKMQEGRLQQRYGDVWGKTVVVKANVFQPNVPRSGGMMFAGIFLGTIPLVTMMLLQIILPWSLELLTCP